MRLGLAIALVATLSGCSDWPELDIDDSADASREYPELASIDALLASETAATEGAEQSAKATAAVEARAALLRRRAAILALPAEDRAALDLMRQRLAALGR